MCLVSWWIGTQLPATSALGRQEEEELVKSGPQSGDLYLNGKLNNKTATNSFLDHNISQEVDSTIFI